MIDLNSKYKGYIFNKLIERFDKLPKASDILNLGHSTLRSYKNGYSKRIPVNFFNKLIGLKIIDSNKELEENIVSRIDKTELINNCLDMGRKIRHEKLKRFKEDLANINIINREYIDVWKWFEIYKNLINFGIKEIKNIEKDFFKVSYYNYANGKRKLFETCLPNKIKIDQEFMYFFGLWVGDKCGGKRFGISNKQKELLDFSEYYLKKFKQNINKDLYIGVEEKILKDLIYDKVIKIRTKSKGYAICIFSYNGILASFFNFLEDRLGWFLSNKFRNNFFGGLFDAEGNVFWDDRCLRWSCKNPILLEILIKHLKEMKLFHRYDGGNMITYNKEGFVRNIFPYLKHPNKINKTELLYYGRGNLDHRYKQILKTIKDNEGFTTKGIAKVLKRVKIILKLSF